MLGRGRTRGGIFFANVSQGYWQDLGTEERKSFVYLALVRNGKESWSHYDRNNI